MKKQQWNIWIILNTEVIAEKSLPFPMETGSNSRIELDDIYDIYYNKTEEEIKKILREIINEEGNMDKFVAKCFNFGNLSIEIKEEVKTTFTVDRG